MSTLTIRGLKKTYANGTQALKGVDLTIPTGMYGLLGPNGAGKSTLMRTIATLQEADEGSIFLDDLDVLKEQHKVRELLGFLPQEFDVYPKVTAFELMEHLAILKGMTDSKKRKEAINIILEKTNLIQYGKKYLGGYSGGMKQRFGIAQALLNNPKLLIVDEPTAGLDPEERNRFLNILGELGENIIVILSTHIVDDVRELCNNMAIINNGNVLIENTPSFVINQLQGKLYQKLVEKDDFRQNIENNEKYKVLSSKLFLGKTNVRLYSDTEVGEGFDAYTGDLEDTYFYYIKGLGETVQNVE